MSYKQIFDILKKENVKTSLSAVKRIGQRFEIEAQWEGSLDLAAQEPQLLRMTTGLKWLFWRIERKLMLIIAKSLKLLPEIPFLEWQYLDDWMKWDLIPKVRKKAIISCNKSFKIGLAHFFCSRVYVFAG